ncbi:ExeM/NucH family extracellular endonuclease [Marinobacter fonticola]|uniref:ExeM/NucH family extracellular endonuclease n=1 Tax=Marinobacter fonticola TaxID=2603215 RepID=UPI0011E7B6D5|nr:ExeM/NucH family extracellular endonuclease [Marinobacter fonticola]
MSVAPLAAADSCGDALTPISAIQGTRDTSPLQGSVQRVEGVITLDGRGPGGLSGFYLQSLPDDTDANVSTSEGLFIFTGAEGGQVGDHVRVEGSIKEYYGLTEMTGRGSVEVCGSAALPAPVPIDLPLTHPERLESMRVTFDQPLAVIDTYAYGRFGAVTLAADDPLRSQRPQQHRKNRQYRILLDDRRLAQNPEILPLPQPRLSAGNSLRTGSRLAPVRGVLDFRYDHWRIQPEVWPDIVIANERPAPPIAPQAGVIRVASFNTLNFFNGDGSGGGFPTARGADNRSELKRQQQKLAAAIRGLEADVVGLMELENDGSDTDSAIAELARTLGEDWAYVSQAFAGGDAIRVGLLYRSDRVEPVGDTRVLSDGVFSRYSRAPVAQDFQSRGGEGRMRVVVNHFKSRSCRNAEGDHRAVDEGCYAPVRERSARELLAWLETLPESGNLLGTLILGDLNTYIGERPLAILAAAGFQRPAVLSGEDQHTYRFKGVRGVLDYILPDESLQSRVTGGDVWHINADEPTVLDYNLEFHPPKRAERLYGPGPWRSSDHDPVYLDIRLDRH